jgi:hypothetical protein
MTRLLLSLLVSLLICTPVLASSTEKLRVGQVVRYTNPGKWVDVPGTEQPNHGPLQVVAGKRNGEWVNFQEQDYTTIRRWKMDCTTGAMELLYSHSYHDDGHDGTEVHKVDEVGDGTRIAFDAKNAPMAFIRKTVCSVN